MGSDGSNQARLTTNTLADVQPQWSPDGSQIAFVRFGPDQNRDIWVMNADGSGDVKIVDDPAFFDIQPDWSPDGNLIAFMSDRGDGLFAIYTVRPDGSHTRRLSPHGMQAGEPAWSPDGREIAFEDEACGTCEESDLFVMDANGGHLRQLTNTSSNEITSDWSPEGDWLSFELDEVVDGTFGFADVAITNDDGGIVLNITQSPTVNDFGAAWRPTPAN
jgi:Tol biopolymer transport system component